jgi:hypothetical protein
LVRFKGAPEPHVLGLERGYIPAADRCRPIKEKHMRLARKLALLAMLATAATALAAPSAFAQTEPELHTSLSRLVVIQEVHAATDAACTAVMPTPPPAPSPVVTSGGCRLHVSAPAVVITAHLSAGGAEVVTSTCDVEFDVRLDMSGEGWISHQELTQGATGTCNRQVCGQPTPPTGEGRAWTIYFQESEVAGVGPRENAVILFCTAPFSDPVAANHCEVTIPIAETTLHRYRFTATDASGHGTAFPHCEWNGTFDQEAAIGMTGEGQLEQNIEIRHT